MDAILDLPPDLPPHDAAPLSPVPHRIVAQWPAGTFVENLAVLPGGDVAVSVLSAARIDRATPAGAVATWRRFEAPPTGLAMMDGALYAAIGEPGAGAPVLWRLDPGGGDAVPWATLEGLSFANGVAAFAPGVLLVADSWQGRLVRVDLAARRVSTWFADERLTRAPGVDFLPGANGVKRFGDAVTVTSTGRALVLQVAVGADGTAGPAAVAAERLRADDLTFDAEGRAYLCTHLGHSLDRLDPDGTRVGLGGPEQGLAGSTACAFHPDGGLYATTTGGILAPPDRVLQPAKLVRLEIGATGYSPDGGAS